MLICPTNSKSTEKLPGFSVQTEDLDALVAAFSDQTEGSNKTRIERYELTGRQILIYVSDLSYEQPLAFSYRLQAMTPASNAYDYYNPMVAGMAPPQTLVVINP